MEDNPGKAAVKQLATKAKFCVACKYHKATLDYSQHFCWHPQQCSVNVVTGEIIPSYCDIARDGKVRLLTELKRTSFGCGPSGRFFETKEEEKK